MFYIGAIMVILSVILITFHNGVLQAAGTALLAAGLTIITTTLTNRESIRRQFAKDANIIRKDAIYGPLFIELKQIYEWLDEAKKKEGRYPYEWPQGTPVFRRERNAALLSLTLAKA